MKIQRITKSPIVAPSLLSAHLAHISREIRAVYEAGADWLHIDVMDGHFVPNLTMGPDIVASIRQVTDMPLDVHLMIENPTDYIPIFAKAGADIVTVHIEVLNDPISTLRQIRHLNVKAGLSLKPDTPVAQIIPFLEEADLILVMTVHPGFSGQEFITGPLEKVRVIRKKSDKILIAVDGGINADTGADCINAGADILVAGNYIFKNDYKKSIQALKGHYS